MPNGNHIIIYSDRVLTEDIPALPKTMQERIRRTIEERLTLDPIALGKPLHYSFRGHRRLRVGDYRIIYRIDAKEKTVVIITIKYRKDVYDE